MHQKITSVLWTMCNLKVPFTSLLIQDAQLMYNVISRILRNWNHCPHLSLSMELLVILKSPLVVSWSLIALTPMVMLSPFAPLAITTLTSKCAYSAHKVSSMACPRVQDALPSPGLKHKFNWTTILSLITLTLPLLYHCLPVSMMQMPLLANCLYILPVYLTTQMTIWVMYNITYCIFTSSWVIWVFNTLNGSCQEVCLVQ